MKNRVFVRLGSRYAYYFTEYSSYFGRALILLKPIYRMTSIIKWFADNFTVWLVYEAGFKQSQYQMTLYYKYVPYETKNVVLIYVDNCVYWYTSEAIVKWFVENLERRFHVNLLGFSHWFIPIKFLSSSTIKYQYIRLDMLLLLWLNI